MSRRRNGGSTVIERSDEVDAAPVQKPTSHLLDGGFPGARSVAIVVASLGNELGAKVLSHFSVPEVEAIVREVKDMPRIPMSEVKDLVGRLRDEAVAQSFAIAGGIDKARELLRRSHGANADAILEQIMAASSSVPFQFLRGRRTEQIVTYLLPEHPQVIALVLAHLPVATSAQVIEGLPADLRADVATRYAKMDSTDPEVVAEVELALLRRVGAGTSNEPTHSRGGIKPLAQLLNNVARDTEKVVLGELDRSDPALASAVRDLMFVFEDIAGLDDRSLQEVLRIADTRTIALALKDAALPVREKIEGNLSKRAAEDVAEYGSTLGMVRRSDVEAAQQEVVRGARKLEEEGKIVLMRSGGGGGGGGEFIS
ncbi:MAG: flagellar motor switch protein FliG [Acidimicrobiales bacterium]|nr:flagellar motor switch protein FliG [Acidimicrobiales bacterium]